MFKWLKWDDLTDEEKSQAEDSYLAYIEDAIDDESDEKFYYELLENKELRIAMLKEKGFDRMEDGYIFVNL